MSSLISEDKQAVTKVYKFEIRGSVDLRGVEAWHEGIVKARNHGEDRRDEEEQRWKGSIENSLSRFSCHELDQFWKKW